jgi:hypothetical protein
MCLGTRGIIFLLLVGSSALTRLAKFDNNVKAEDESGKDWAVSVLVFARQVSDWRRRIGERYGQRLEVVLGGLV